MLYELWSSREHCHASHHSIFHLMLLIRDDIWHVNFEAWLGSFTFQAILLDVSWMLSRCMRACYCRCHACACRGCAKDLESSWNTGEKAERWICSVSLEHLLFSTKPVVRTSINLFCRAMLVYSERYSVDI